MKVVIGSDHNGYVIKREIIKYLNQNNFEVKDMGTDDETSTDYPIYAKKVCNEVLKSNEALGILFCGTGIGMSIAANKIKGIRCAKVDNEEESYLARSHNNANVISISSKKEIEEIKSMVLKFLKSEFLNEERHVRRINEIE